ncbi:MAG: TonB-dependent receptor [Thiotrichales bacterium]
MRFPAAFSLGITFAGLASAAPDTLETIEIRGHHEVLVGEAVSASEGIVGQAEIASRPMLRSGEILETVPGMVVTQHSGTGKANQYFLRGFNLDHGSDFRTEVDAVPVNMRTHGHGQGYTDINFIIPELVERIDYKKGPFYASVGDFSGAGAANFSLASALDKNLLHLGLGEDGYLRLLAANNLKVNNGSLLLAYEGNRYDGPWVDIEEDLRKHNFYLRRAWRSGENGYYLTLMGYDNQWNSADQIPERAVESGLIDRLGSLDTSVGGESSRYSLAARMKNARWDSTLYAMRYDMDLWSNFTYLLDDPVNGDQFQQVDSRNIYGADIRRRFANDMALTPTRHTLGLQLRFDDIDEVGLHRSVNRTRVASVRSDKVRQGSAGLFWEASSQWTSQLRTNAGLRYDFYDFDVDSLQPVNSGQADDGIVSAKFNLAYSFSPAWELYSGLGQGFHSNDARGVTIKVDPVSGDAVDAVDPLVRSLGAEIGLRFNHGEKLNASIALWALKLDSELLFVGDAGNTEASRASERQGVEFTAYYRVTPHLTLDSEIAWTRARFSEDAEGEGNRVDGSLPLVISLGAAWESSQGWFAAARLRHFGERTLDSFDDVKSDTSTAVNLRLGKQLRQLEFGLDVLNLFDSKDHDIDYLYASRLSGEIADGVEDIHFHPLEPRTLRAYVNYRY